MILQFFADQSFTRVVRSDQANGHHGGLLLAMGNDFLRAVNLIYF